MEPEEVERLKVQMAAIKNNLRILKKEYEDAKDTYYLIAKRFIKKRDKYNELDRKIAEATMVRVISKGKSGKPKKGGDLVPNAEALLANMPQEMKIALLQELGVTIP